MSSPDCADSILKMILTQDDTETGAWTDHESAERCQRIPGGIGSPIAHREDGVYRRPIR